MESALNGQSLLITGASGGIGLATATALAAEGTTLALHYHRNRTPLDDFAQDLQTPHAIVQADVADEDQVEAMFAQAVGSLGRIDSVVVNAGYWGQGPSPLCDMDLDQFEQTLRINLTGAFLTCRAFLRHLKAVPRESASIVLVGSTAAMFGEADHADYAAAKAGMTYGLTRTLKNEIIRLAPRGRVNAVAPGWVKTSFGGDDAVSDEAVLHASRTMALRKIATPEDVAAAITFLLSDKLSGHISGAILPIAGGMEGRMLHDS